MSRKGIVLFTAASMWMSAVAQPLAADPSECYDDVLESCADAMEDANFIERWAIGLACTGMLAGCAASEIDVSISIG